MTKTVIMIWLKTHSGTNPNGSIKAYGLGDLLRGTIYLHQMSIQLGFKLVVDLSMHAISNYLIVNEHEHAAYVKANVNKLHFVDPHETTKFNVIFKASLGAKDPLLICTNMFCSEPLSAECKQFMKTLLTPNEEFTNYMIQQNAAYELSAPYSIMHIRLGDDEFFENISINNSNANDAVAILKQHAGPRDILLSNSHRFKERVKSLPGTTIAMFNTRPLHLGELSTIFHDNVADWFKETLYEFFVLGHASTIKTYSVYDWVSGFVKFAGLIHDVPVIDLKPTQFSQKKPLPQSQFLMRSSHAFQNNVRFGLKF